MPNIIIRMDFSTLQIKTYSSIPGFSNWYQKRDKAQVNGITMHHTVTKRTGNADADVNAVLSIHRGNGWGGIGYHFLITSEIIDGRAVIAYVGDVNFARAHAIGTLTDSSANFRTLGISIVGDLRTDEILNEQAQSLYELVQVLLFQSPDLPNLVDINKVKPHWKEDPTACPVKWDEIWQIINKLSPKVDGTLEDSQVTDWLNKYDLLKSEFEKDEIEDNKLLSAKDLQIQDLQREVVELRRKDTNNLATIDELEEANVSLSNQLKESKNADEFLQSQIQNKESLIQQKNNELYLQETEIKELLSEKNQLVSELELKSKELESKSAELLAVSTSEQSLSTKVELAEKVIEALKRGDGRPWSVVLNEFLKSLFSRKLIITVIIMLATFFQTGDFTLPAISAIVYSIVNVLEKQSVTK